MFLEALAFEDAFALGCFISPFVSPFLLGFSGMQDGPSLRQRMSGMRDVGREHLRQMLAITSRQKFCGASVVSWLQIISRIPSILSQKLVKVVLDAFISSGFAELPSFTKANSNSCSGKSLRAIEVLRSQCSCTRRHYTGLESGLWTTSKQGWV